MPFFSFTSFFLTHVIVLALLPLFKIVLLGLQLDYGVPELVSLGPELLD